METRRELSHSPRAQNYNLRPDFAETSTPRWQKSLLPSERTQMTFCSTSIHEDNRLPLSHSVAFDLRAFRVQLGVPCKEYVLHEQFADFKMSSGRRHTDERTGQTGSFFQRGTRFRTSLVVLANAEGNCKPGEGIQILHSTQPHCVGT